MKTKVKFITIYKKVKEDKVIVTLLAKPSFNYDNYIDVRQINCIEKYLTSFIYKGARHLGFLVAGKAKCHPNDEFDETIGYRIAEARAKAKLYKKASLFYNKLSHYMYANADIAKNIMTTNYDCMNKEYKHIDKLNG